MQRYDVDGALAASGRVHDAMLAELLASVAFPCSRPRHRRELFGAQFVDPFIDRVLSAACRAPTLCHAGPRSRRTDRRPVSAFYRVDRRSGGLAVVDRATRHDTLLSELLIQPRFVSTKTSASARPRGGLLCIDGSRGSLRAAEHGAELHRASHPWSWARSCRANHFVVGTDERRAGRTAAPGWSVIR
jgi:hypothetical protein